MMGNDCYNDCTCAAAGHLIMGWTAKAGHPVIPTTRSILAAYAAVTGFVKRTRAHDKGARALHVLKHWRKHGIAGHRIKAFLALDLKDREQLKMAVYRFGGCYIGLDLVAAHATPCALQRRRVWRAPRGHRRRRRGAPDPEKGHVVAVMGYDADGLLCASWTKTYRMTWGFWETCVDEAFAILSPDWLRRWRGHRRLPLEFDLDAVMADVKKATRVKRRRA